MKIWVKVPGMKEPMLYVVDQANPQQAFDAARLLHSGCGWETITVQVINSTLTKGE